MTSHLGTQLLYEIGLGKFDSLLSKFPQRISQNQFCQSVKSTQVRKYDINTAPLAAFLSLPPFISLIYDPTVMINQSLDAKTYEKPLKNPGCKKFSWRSETVDLP